MLALVAATVLAPWVRTLVLECGAPTPDGVGYWEVEDTFLDSKAPDANYGRDRLLTAGTGRTVLIRFGDLARALGPRAKVAEARLLLRLEIGRAPKLKSARLLSGFWNEGPGRRDRIGLDAPLPEGEKTPLPEGAATWRHRISGKGPTGWERAGALGSKDGSPVAGAAISAEGDWVAVAGLAGAVQAMKDRPWVATGLALEFEGSADFASSDAAAGRPRLEVAIEDGPPVSGPDLAVTRIEWDQPSGMPTPGTMVGWTAVVENVGDAPAPAFSGRWIDRTGPISPATSGPSLAPGDEAKISIRLPFRGDPARPGAHPLAFAVDGSDAEPANNGLITWEAATPVAVSSASGWAIGGHPRVAAQRTLALWNQTVLAHSRFSFAPEGALPRFRAQSWSVEAALGPGGESLRQELAGWAARLAPFEVESPTKVAVGGVERPRPADPFPGLRGWGDTRDEIDLIPQVPLLYEPWADDEQIEGLGMRPSGLLAATEVALLNSKIGLPKTVIVTLFNGVGQPAREQAIEAYVLDGGAAKGPVTLKTSKTGNFVVPAEIGGVRTLADPKRPRTVAIRVKQGSVDEVGYLAGWQIADAYARLGQPAGFLNLRMAIAAANVDGSNDLAANKIVVDARGSLPAVLAAIVDGNPQTASTVPAGPGWIEIDLGRDRLVGEVRIEVDDGKIWPKFRILAYATGQRAAEAREWAREQSGEWMLAHRGDGRTVAYRGAAARARFVRIQIPEGAPAVRVAGIAVFPLTSE